MFRLSLLPLCTFIVTNVFFRLLSVTVGNHAEPEDLRSLASQLNQTKATYIHDLRKQLLLVAPFTQGEDIDTDQVVKRAVEVFDQQKTEILLRLMCGHK